MTGVGLPNGYSQKGFCSQIAIFKRKALKDARQSTEIISKYEILLHNIVPINFPMDFHFKFFNDLLYSANIARN